MVPGRGEGHPAAYQPPAGPRCTRPGGHLQLRRISLGHLRRLWPCDSVEEGVTGILLWYGLGSKAGVFDGVEEGVEASTDGEEEGVRQVFLQGCERSKVL